MSTRRERELRLTGDQAAYVGKALNASIRRVVALFQARSANPTSYHDGHHDSAHDRAIVMQVLNGIAYELHRDLEDTLSRVTRKYIP